MPYDVVSTDEARALVRDNPLSFLRVTRAEVDLPPETHPYDAAVYAQAVRNFEELKRAAPLLLDPDPTLYCYRLRMGSHEQTGVAGCFPLDDYDRGLIKKHEKTRKDKEDDRTRHMIDLGAQTGVVFLTYRASQDVDDVVRRISARQPVYDFVAPDGVAHTVWQAPGADVETLVRAFRALPALYIADGHHRVASAARARDTLASTGRRSTGADQLVAVAFPDRDVQILPYNRAVKDLAGHTPESFLSAVRTALPVRDGVPATVRQGEVGMYLAGTWHTLTLPALTVGEARGAETLDVERLQRHVLGPVLGIGDPRTDKRIDFIGGVRGSTALERLVTGGQAAVAFALHPVSVRDLMTIADGGGIMPPKSTWFEPKLRDGLFVHLI